MAKIGEVKKGKEIGKKPPESKFIWHACQDCGKERWTRYIVKTKAPDSLICGNCRQIKQGEWLTQFVQENNPSWRGGRHKSKDGYIFIRLSKDDFFYPMAASNNSYIAEHRLVMAKHLSRCLHSWEIVHHKHTKYPAGSKEDKQDNRIENLQLVQEMQHNQMTRLEQRISYLEQILSSHNIPYNGKI